MADLKLALRTLSRAPFVMAVAVLSLALGIGANAAIYSIFDQMLLRPLPVHEPETLVNLTSPGPKSGAVACSQAGPCEQVFSNPMFRDLEREQTEFTGIAAHALFGANLAVGQTTVNGGGMLVSGSYFPVLGLRPALGRLLTPEDDRTPGAHPVAVLSHRFWENQLGHDPDVLNSTILVNGHPMTVVGVAPAGFDGTTLGGLPEIYVPIMMRGEVIPNWTALDNRRAYWAYLFGRLKPGTTEERATAELNAIYARILEEVEVPLNTGMSDATLAEFRAKRIALLPGDQGHSSVRDDVRTPMRLLLGITAIVLLIACANIANLLLARGAARAQEMAIRGSLGASRRQLLRQLLTEALVLAVLGGAAALLVARATLVLVGSFVPADTGAVLSLELRPVVVAFVAAVALGTGVLFGLYPAVHATRPGLATTMRGTGGQAAGSRSAARFRTSLVTAQIALSMALLVGATLFLRSLTNVARVDLGLDERGVVTFAVSPELNGYDGTRSHEVFRRLSEELAALPGVTAVTAGRVPLLAGSNWGSNVAVEGFEQDPDTDANANFNDIAPGYFRTLGIPLIAGREFTAADGADAPRVAIINEAFARKFGLDPRRAPGTLMARGNVVDSTAMQIVGVVADAKYSEVKDAVPPLFFTPYAQDATVGTLNYYVRTAATTPVLRAVPDVVRRIDPQLPVEELKTLERQAAENVMVDRMISTLATAFASLATLLAAIGLYGVLAYTVAQRTREIGLRMALGAQRSLVGRMILLQVGRMLLVGGVLGLLAALALGRAAGSLLYGLGGRDPLALATAAVLLSAVAFGAGYLPARRASRVDPMEALRYE